MTDFYQTRVGGLVDSGIMVFMMEALAFAAAAAAAAPRIDPAYAVNITVYHVNEHSFGAVPINMNTCVRPQALCVRGRSWPSSRHR